MWDTIELLPVKRIALEILEDIPINAQIITRCKALKELSFKIAIVDYANRSEHIVLLPHVNYVKIDLLTISLEQAATYISVIRKKSAAKIVAEKVEDEVIF